MKAEPILWMPSGALPALPGASGTKYLYDPTDPVQMAVPGLPALGGQAPHRVVISGNWDQGVTIQQQVKWLASDVGWSVFNNGGLGDAATANQPFSRDYYNHIAPFVRYAIVAGGTPPTTASRMAVGFVYERTLAVFA
jgi:hypothetical protein